MMLIKVAAALIAVTMFTAPVLAQSVAPVSPTPAPQTIKAPVKHVKVKKHTMKKVGVFSPDADRPLAAVQEKGPENVRALVFG